MTVYYYANEWPIKVSQMSNIRQRSDQELQIKVQTLFMYTQTSATQSEYRF